MAQRGDGGAEAGQRFGHSLAVPAMAERFSHSRGLVSDRGLALLYA